MLGSIREGQKQIYGLFSGGIKHKRSQQEIVCRNILVMNAGQII